MIWTVTRILFHGTTVLSRGQASTAASKDPVFCNRFHSSSCTNSDRLVAIYLYPTLVAEICRDCPCILNPSQPAHMLRG